MKLFNVLTIAALSAAMLASCKKDDNNGNNNNNGSNATTFKVRMTDAPGNFLAMNTQITSIDAMVNGEWVNLSSENQTVSVLSLTNGMEEMLANEQSADTGHYTMLRITFGTTNTINVMENGEDTQHNLAFGAGVDNEVVIPIDWQLDKGDDASLLIDFNVAGSVSSLLGNWFMDPQLTWVQDESTGVKGRLTGASNAVITFSGNGEEYSSWINNTGYFMIRGMESGTYDVMIQGMHTGQTSEDDMQMQDVVVTQGSITNMGNITFE